MMCSHSDEWIVEDPDKEDTYLVAFVGYINGNRWPKDKHFYALADWFGDSWDRLDFPKGYNEIKVLAWQPLPDYFDGE